MKIVMVILASALAMLIAAPVRAHGVIAFGGHGMHTGGYPQQQGPHYTSPMQRPMPVYRPQVERRFSEQRFHGRLFDGRRFFGGYGPQPFYGDYGGDLGYGNDIGYGGGGENGDYGGGYSGVGEAQQTYSRHWRSWHRRTFHRSVTVERYIPTAPWRERSCRCDCCRPAAPTAYDDPSDDPPASGQEVNVGYVPPGFHITHQE